MSRRLLAAAGGLALLTACGFRPLYGVRDNGTVSPAEQGLAEISIALIPERSGQLLRQALQARFERSGGGVAKRYDLSVGYGIQGDTLNIAQTTSIPSRLRLVGTANWALISQDTRRRTLATGTARSVDGLNIFDQQFFALDMQSEAVQRRIAEQVAEQMALQLAAWFNRQPTTE